MKVGTDGVILGAYADCKSAQRILDIGTGSGLIAIMLAQRCDARIDAIDINSEAIEIAKKNVFECPWTERINILESSVQDYEAAEKYDLIVSNPPFYIEDTIAPTAGRAMARHSSALDYKDLLVSIERLLSDNGSAFVIYPTAMSELFEQYAISKNLFPKSRLLISSMTGTPPIRIVLEVSRHKTNAENKYLRIEKASRHDYSEEYIGLTKDYYLKF